MYNANCNIIKINNIEENIEYYNNIDYYFDNRIIQNIDNNIPSAIILNSDDFVNTRTEIPYNDTNENIELEVRNIIQPDIIQPDIIFNENKKFMLRFIFCMIIILSCIIGPILFIIKN